MTFEELTALCERAPKPRRLAVDHATWSMLQQMFADMPHYGCAPREMRPVVLVQGVEIVLEGAK